VAICFVPNKLFDAQYRLHLDPATSRLLYLLQADTNGDSLKSQTAEHGRSVLCKDRAAGVILPQMVRRDDGPLRKGTRWCPRLLHAESVEA
jgi:hypothetical protein